MVRMKFRATHRITERHPDGRRRCYRVCLVDGVAYTKEEWEGVGHADWTLDEEGIWLWRGQAPTHLQSYQISRLGPQREGGWS